MSYAFPRMSWLELDHYWENLSTPNTIEVKKLILPLERNLDQNINNSFLSLHLLRVLLLIYTNETVFNFQGSLIWLSDRVSLEFHRYLQAFRQTWDLKVYRYIIFTHK